MKLFVLTTKSASCDNYSYIIKHSKQPTSDEIKAFLIEHSCDRDDEEKALFEYEVHLVEVSFDDAVIIPKMTKKDLDKWNYEG